MKLTIVGSGDAFGSGGRLNTCFRIEAAGRDLLLDCGASSLPALKSRNIDPSAINGVMLSHLHGDHFGGVVFLLMDGHFLGRRTRPLVIAGPPGTRERLNAALEVFFPRSTGIAWRYPWEVVEIAPRTPSKILGLSIETIVSIAKNADLFIVECYEHSRAVTGHMSWTKLKERLGDLDARKIMITHMNPSMLANVEEARASGVLIASDGLVLEL